MSQPASKTNVELESHQSLCPSCEFESSRVWGQRDAHVIYECEACRLLYFSRPIENSFDYQEYYPYLAGFGSSRFQWEVGVRRPKFLKQLGRIRDFVPHGKSLLDVGAGPGYFCAVAVEHGWDARGVEPSKVARAAGARVFNVTYCDLDEIEDASIDVITCHHVLEHIDDVNEFLSKLRCKLTAGGMLVLHVPNRQPLSFLIRDRLRGGRQQDTACTLYYPVHVNGFTPTSLISVVGRHPFKTERTVNASMWSMYYDPFFIRNYYRGDRG